MISIISLSWIQSIKDFCLVVFVVVAVVAEAAVVFVIVFFVVVVVCLSVFHKHRHTEASMLHKTHEVLAAAFQEG